MGFLRSLEAFIGPVELRGLSTKRVRALARRLTRKRRRRLGGSPRSDPVVLPREFCHEDVDALVSDMLIPIEDVMEM